MAELAEILRSRYEALDLHDTLRKPTSVLLGVSPAASEELRKLGIETVFDLGTAWLFANARAAADSAQLGSVAARFGLAPSDWLVSGTEYSSLDRIGDLPLESLRGMEGVEAGALKTALDVETIRDLAYWPPRLTAHELVGRVSGSTVSAEEQQAEELRPRFGEYPTERVYYSTLVMLQMQESEALGDLKGPIPLDPLVSSKVGFSKLAVGALLTYSQSWYAQGITLGHLLHCLTLAPGETTRLAVIDWSRRTRAATSETVSETESLDNATEHARAISEVQNAVATEFQQGGSQSGGWAQSQSRSVGYAEGSGLLGGLFGGSDTSITEQSASSSAYAWSTGWSSGNRSILDTMTQHVNDRTEQHANSVRNRRASAVREVSQSEHEEVSTRVVANYNHMHALTVQYYEVVQIYRVMAALHRAERCLFVPLQLIDFGSKTALEIIERFRGALMAGALTRRVRELLLDPTTAVAIRPVTIIRQPLPWATPMTTSSARYAMRRKVTDGEIPAAERDVSDTGTKSVLTMAFWDARALALASQAVSRPLLRQGSDAIHLPDETELVGIAMNGLDVKSIQLDRIAASASDTVQEVPAGAAQIDVPVGTRLLELGAIFLTRNGDSIASGTITLLCSYLGRRFASPPIPVNLDTAGPQRVVDISNDQEDRRKELVAHLTANQAHYSQAIFRSLDSSALTMLLSQYRWNGKPLADQVEPRPISIAGNYLVFRAPVEDMESSGVTEGGRTRTWGELLESRHIRQTLPDPRLIPIPTGGVFAEAVLGRSNSAEKLDITRFWNWQDSPIPLQAPDIAPVTTGTRATPEDLKPGQLSSPVLNIVNPTSLPEPTGLGALLTALSSGSMFRDMSGLAGTQGLVRAGMSETLTAATDAGQIASTNMKTEAQKQVAMGQIIGDIAKAAITGVPSGGGSSAGISGEGARINHGRDMDERGVPGPDGAVTTSGETPTSTGESNTSTNGDSANGASVRASTSTPSSGSEYSHEGAYADKGAFGYSPDAVRSTTNSVSKAATPSKNRRKRTFHIAFQMDDQDAIPTQGQVRANLSLMNGISVPIGSVPIADGWGAKDVAMALTDSDHGHLALSFNPVTDPTARDMSTAINEAVRFDGDAVFNAPPDNELLFEIRPKLSEPVTVRATTSTQAKQTALESVTISAELKSFLEANLEFVKTSLESKVGASGTASSGTEVSEGSETQETFTVRWPTGGLTVTQRQ